MGLRLGHHLPFWIVWSFLNEFCEFCGKRNLKIGETPNVM